MPFNVLVEPSSSAEGEGGRAGGHHVALDAEQGVADVLTASVVDGRLLLQTNGSFETAQPIKLTVQLPAGQLEGVTVRVLAALALFLSHSCCARVRALMHIYPCNACAQTCMHARSHARTNARFQHKTHTCAHTHTRPCNCSQTRGADALVVLRRGFMPQRFRGSVDGAASLHLLGMPTQRLTLSNSGCVTQPFQEKDLPGKSLE